MKMIPIILVIVLLCVVVSSGCKKNSSNYVCQDSTDFDKMLTQYNECKRSQNLLFSENCLSEAMKTHCEEKKLLDF